VNTAGLPAVALTAVALYATTFTVIRVAGRRTVSQLSAFDALVTVALGSIIASSIVSDPPSYRRGAVAIVTLVALQVAVGAARQRIPKLRRVLDFSAVTVFRDGQECISRNPLGAQLTPDAIETAVRAADISPGMT
jgi:uncharacterized membrane protein YcaP (DUF421 family)